jgi:hypothetical protein
VSNFSAVKYQRPPKARPRELFFGMPRLKKMRPPPVWLFPLLHICFVKRKHAQSPPPLWHDACNLTEQTALHKKSE